jgi:hypothetical protein
MSAAAVAFCAFALMIAGPILILAWFGSLTLRDAKRGARLRQSKTRESDALLWQRTLQELEPAWAVADRTMVPVGDLANAPADPEPQALSRVASALAGLVGAGKRTVSPILALCITVASAFNLAGCGVPPEAWAAVRPGMGTKDLVALVGGPDYVRSNGTVEVWQYCRDFPGRDEGRYARYYTAVIVDKREVREVQPFPAVSAAGCEDYYRADF